MTLIRIKPFWILAGFFLFVSCKSLSSVPQAKTEQIYKKDFVFFIVKKDSGDFYCITQYGTLSELVDDSARLDALIHFKDTMGINEVGDSLEYVDSSHSLVRFIYATVSSTTQEIQEIEISEENYNHWFPGVVFISFDNFENNYFEYYLPMYLQGYVCVDWHEGSALFEKKIFW